MRIVYSEALMEHFLRPRYVGELDSDSINVGTGAAGSPDTGGVLRMQVQVSEDGLISDARFKAYGPPALIASGSWLSQALLGGSLEQAEAVTHQAIVAALALPPARLHCAFLAEDAIRAAIQEYKDKQRAHV